MTQLPLMEPLVAVRRQRVGLAGHVLRADGMRGGGGWVSLVRQAADGIAVHDAPRQAKVAADGLYFFLNLAAGDYVVQGQDERGRPLAPRLVNLPPVDLARRPEPINVDLVIAADQPPGQAGAAP